MPRLRHLLDALRVPALWLLVASVFFGPAGLAGATGFAATAKSCGLSCPCDEAVHEPHAEAPHDDQLGAAHDEDDAGQDACPGDCPNCGCGLGGAMAVLPLPAATYTAACIAARSLTPVSAPPRGATTGVFRPPRSLT